MFIYYVYQYLRDDLTPYYIGKGKGNRAYMPHGKLPLPKDKSLIKVIAHELSEIEAHRLEIKLIEYYGRKDLNTGILRNLSSGGEGASGAKRTDTMKKVQSDIRKSKFAKGELTIWSTGKKLGPRTNETRKKISIANTGKTHTEKTKANLSALFKGKPKSDEIKANMSAAQKGRLVSKETGIKISDSKKAAKLPSPMLGKKHSDSTKAKIREARARQLISDETKKKMSDSQKKRHSGNK